MDLKLDHQTHDLVFINGECPVTTERREVVAQRLQIRLKTLFGEWFMNVDYGVPYLERILGHKINKNSVDNILQSQILDENGVKGITYFTSELSMAREYSCRFRVRVDDGTESSLVEIQSW